MARIVVLCEGDTEERALQQFIGRRWRAEGLGHVGLQGINLGGKLQDIGKYTVRYLGETEILAVFTLLDLQGMTYVKHGVSDGLELKINRVRKWLRDQAKSADGSRFRAHVCVHQIEAWILAEGHTLAARLNANLEPDAEAESKNFQNPPAKRLNDLFRLHAGRSYRKIIDGTRLFAKMEFEPVYKSCQYFREFYDDLKTAARG